MRNKKRPETMCPRKASRLIRRFHKLNKNLVWRDLTGNVIDKSAAAGLLVEGWPLGMKTARYY